MRTEYQPTEDFKGYVLTHISYLSDGYIGTSLPETFNTFEEAQKKMLDNFEKRCEDGRDYIIKINDSFPHYRYVKFDDNSYDEYRIWDTAEEDE